MIDMSTQTTERDTLLDNYRKVRRDTELICTKLDIDDYQIQSIAETSPPKWHIAHVTWFFEEFVLSYFNPDYKPFDSRFSFLFNSYYETVGRMQPRPKRGMLSRPTVEEVYRYRHYVNEHMLSLAVDINENLWNEFSSRVILGLNHEQQHQELLLMDIKHNFAVNPLKPAYNPQLISKTSEHTAMKWIDQSGGVTEIGHHSEAFAYDNEKPRHQVLLHDHQLASRLVTNEEYLAFMDDEGYSRPELWLADGWSLINREGWRHPLYWESIDGEWWLFTLGGMRKLESHEPVCHVSYYEADAYARWSGKRLPTEEEIETILTEVDVEGNLLNHNVLHPLSGNGQWYGDVWEWTSSAYGPYPGFQPLDGSMGEYNGKFMCNQMVLRGGCCITPQHHMRATYRNFFYPHDRWSFAGLRLAGDL